MLVLYSMPRHHVATAHIFQFLESSKVSFLTQLIMTTYLDSSLNGFIHFYHFSHRHDIHFKPLAVKRCAVTVHPTQFLELHAELVIFNLALLIPEQRISIYREVQVAKKFEEDEMFFVLIYRLAKLIHDGWFKMLVAILRHQHLILLVCVDGFVRTFLLRLQEVQE